MRERRGLEAPALLFCVRRRRSLREEALNVRNPATEERSAALHPEESEGLGGKSAGEPETDGAFVPLPPELWCAALWEEDTALSL
jgi:hypothetical protein